MTIDEMRELLELRFDGSTARLASDMDLHQSTVERWFNHDSPPKGPAMILMRIWLAETRGSSKPSKKLAAAK